MNAESEAIREKIRNAIIPGYRENLLARGHARGMIWRDGTLPTDAPKFSGLLTYDLLSYGYSLLGYGLRLLDDEPDSDLARRAMENAASAIEAVVARGATDSNADFHRVVSASAYHIGGFSARAYSLLHPSALGGNVSASEQCLIFLILREMDALSAHVADSMSDNSVSDDSLAETLNVILGGATGSLDDDELPDLFQTLDLVLADNFMRAIGQATLALERGERRQLDEALSRLSHGLELAGEMNLVPQWWCHRLAIHFIEGLWNTSLHNRLPESPDGLQSPEWRRLRGLFIASLYRRRRAEIDLWPSQLVAAANAVDVSKDMVLSLPTSAGKTRIAELCILRTLAEGKRVVFVTPLRALSAQTEIILERTFRPLGKTVSSLYGSIGVSDTDEDVLRNRDIVVTTPEKLDFALRSDPELLNDVGLIVLDEGHMIGLNEREIRYEVQIQRLLRRADVDTRRIICLSAVLPEGDELEDFAAWLTRDNPEGLVQSGWRPTRLRFGEVVWRDDRARLSIDVDGEETFVPRFITAIVPPGRQNPFPHNQRELCLATAWRLVEDGHSVLIFCPQRNSVEPFASSIVTLNRQGALPSLFDGSKSELSTALLIGEEWFGADHPILQCLKLGVAIHHGALPTPFRKEVERLLRLGSLKVTVSSPTLAQGLNLSATSLLFFGLKRGRSMLSSADFRNVVGRAGRAYVDLEGLVLNPIFKNVSSRRRDWNNLVSDKVGRGMESGLVQLVIQLLTRMMRKIGSDDLEGLMEYVANNAAWKFPSVDDQSGVEEVEAEHEWNDSLASLDTAILSLLGGDEIAEAAIEKTLDAVLGSSLWQRRLMRKTAPIRAALRAGLAGRAQSIWRQSTSAERRGYFLAGVGLETGKQLDQNAERLRSLLEQADKAVRTGDDDKAVVFITEFAEIVFEIEPFKPDKLPENWREILAAWLRGESIASFTKATIAPTLGFIEQVLVYRLPWALEAVRVHASAAAGRLYVQTGVGMAVAAVETGALDRTASQLMRAGFTARMAAIGVAEQGLGSPKSMPELREWVRSAPLEALAQDLNWPTTASHALWIDFVHGLEVKASRAWNQIDEIAEVDWATTARLSSGTALRAYPGPGGESILQTSDYRTVGILKSPVNPQRVGLLTVTVDNEDKVLLQYRGPDDLRLLG